MRWYAVHAVMYFNWKRGKQRRFSVWENALLVKANLGTGLKQLVRPAFGQSAMLGIRGDRWSGMAA